MNTNTIEIVKDTECTGCGACYNMCPTSAIEMKPNDEGFLFPVVNEKTCIDCGKCKKCCPALEYVSKKNSAPECYAVWASDEIRMKSSSGGMFTLLADYVLEQGGYVCGAVWNKDWGVEHVLSNDKKTIEKMRQSKYVQSDTKKVFSEIKEVLNEDKTVLFTGCPCQVAGLEKYLEKKYEKLITVDIVCHGVPSPMAFDKYLDSECLKIQKNINDAKSFHFTKDGIKEISFRDKEAFGWSYGFQINFKKSFMYRKQKWESSWYSSFLNTLNTRKVCGNCKYATIPRTGDFTLGDFWGIEDYDSSWVDKKGTSLVLNNSSLATAVFNKLSSKYIRYATVPIDISRRCNWNVFGSSKLHKDRRRFFKLLSQNSDYDRISNFAHKRHFDVALIGWWYGKNFGSVLTNFALHQYLESKNYSVLMVEWPWKKKPFPKTPDTPTRRFARKYYESSMKRTYEELPQLNHYCDCFLVGSDQLWNYWSTKENGAFFFLDFVNDNRKKISYATSFGHSIYGGPPELTKKVSQCLQRFDKISVREDDGIDICKNTFNVDAVRNVEPVFLCDRSEYEAIINDCSLTDKDYIFAYYLSPTKEKADELKVIANTLGKKVILVLDAQENIEENKAIMDMNDCLREKLEISDWLYYINNAEFVLTDSFHCSCFSVIFEKQFFTYPNQERGLSRFVTLAELTGLKERLTSILDVNSIVRILTSKVDYNEVNDRLAVEVKKSQEWLISAVSSDNSIQPTEDVTKFLEKNNAFNRKVNFLQINARMLFSYFNKNGFVKTISKLATVLKKY